MKDDGIDYAEVFRGLPGMVALITPEPVFADANGEFLRMSGRTREQVVGRYLFDVFPDNPNNPAATGMRNLEASLQRVLSTGERDAMALQPYDVQSLERPGEWVERYWSPVNAPVFGPDWRVVLLVHRVEEVTELIKARGAPDTDRTRVLEAEPYAPARELQDVDERLRQAHAREREVALALQQAMLPVPGPVGRHRPAVRYRPAVRHRPAVRYRPAVRWRPAVRYRPAVRHRPAVRYRPAVRWRPAVRYRPAVRCRPAVRYPQPAR